MECCDKTLVARLIYLDEEIHLLKTTYAKRYESFIEAQQLKYRALVEEVEDLLPGKITQELSEAFTKKKNEEVQLNVTLQRRFNVGISIMTGISFLPVVVSVFFAVQGVSFDEIMLRLPQLAIMMIPMYLPILWYTYATNKKINISKRLIEEYTHKETLGKTYEGFSTHVNRFVPSAENEKLRLKLLDSLLEASSDNPGKFVTNFNKADHPIAEALAQTEKLSQQLKTLSETPGLEHIAAVFKRKKEK
ncbi:hypothetical protein GCM10009117_02630 [Gangjinia marincola]|uniref:Uncharacterized protein n=1 Tax=Gangjinia marincola TaxID=578463 RepID=A0ABP3XSI3_9FLAO